MPTYVAFLRAINLGARRKFPKDDLRRVVQAAGFTDVETYINTGNVRFRTPMRSVARVEAALEAAFFADRSFPVPTIVFPLPELARVATDAAELSQRHPTAQRCYVDLLRVAPPADVAERIEAASSAAMTFAVRGRAVHSALTADPSSGEQGPDVTRLLGVSTNRNATVVREIARRWC